MTLRYTLIEGTLNGENKSCKLPFALVFEENGVYSLETFLEESFFEKEDFSERFGLFGITEKGFEIEITDLTFRHFNYQNRKAKFVCRNYLKLTEKKNLLQKEQDDKKEDSILFIEIEGLNTKFGNHTDIKKYRQYGEVDEFNVDFDHTSCALYIQIEGFEENYFHIVFSKSQSNDNILIDFTRTEGYGLLTFEHYKILKKRFIGFLSLLNGGDIHVRRELTGKFYRFDGLESHIVYNYSFVKTELKNTSNYVPINEHHSYSSQIFQKAFRDCFNSFYHHDVELKLTSVVASLNAAYSTTGIHQAYSILINALEKLCSNHQLSINEFQEHLIDNKIWIDTIKSRLFEELDKSKSLINSSNKRAYDIFKSKIGGLNRRENSTVQKMFDLFDFGCIPINSNVRNLVQEERHTAVHNGEFGKNSTEMYLNYQKLDHILRDIILNIIDYRSYRKPIAEYATIDERKEAYPLRERKPATYYC